MNSRAVLAGTGLVHHEREVVEPTFVTASDPSHA